MHVTIEGLEALIERVVDQKLTAALATQAEDPWLNSEQAAGYLNLARSTIHDLISEGKLPRYGGRKTKIMLRRSDLDAYVARRGKTLRSLKRGIRAAECSPYDTGTNKSPGGGGTPRGTAMEV